MRKLIKRLLEALPFKKQAYCLLRRYYSPPKSIYQHLHFRGRFSTSVDGRELLLNHYGQVVENEIFWTGLRGGWEGASMSLWMELCKTSHFILDVGANTGIYALVAKTINPEAEVFAFEPVQRVYDRLVSNCTLNGYGIHCIRKAVSNFDGNATIYDTQADHIYSVTVNRNLNAPEVPTIKVEIETLTLATLLQSLPTHSRIDLMKLDVESQEPEVLEGMGAYLRQMRPALLVEIVTTEAAQRIEQLVRDMDYLFFNIDAVGKPKRQAHLTKSDHWNFLICREQEARQLRLI